MKSTRLVRWGGLTSMLGGVLWIAMFQASLPDELYESIARYNGLSCIPLTLFLVGLVGLYAGWEGKLELVEKIGFILTLPGFAIAIIGNIVRLFLSDTVARELAAAIQLCGIAILSIGMMLFGVAAIRARALPRWSGTPFITGLLGILVTLFSLLSAFWMSNSTLFHYVTFVVIASFGVVWIGLGYSLWSTPFAWVEKKMEQASTWLKNLAFFEILEYLGKLAILVVVIFYFVQWDDRERAQRYEAWRVITSAQGQEGTGGRIEALETLSAAGESLEGVIAENAYLQGLELEEGTNLDGAQLRETDLSNAILRDVSLKGEVNLEEATLKNAHLEGSNLTNANLRGADLSHAWLNGAILTYANLHQANLSGAHLNDLADADLRGADLTGAILEGADLSDADLRGATLSYAYLSEANLVGAKLEGANFLGAELSDTDVGEGTDLRGVKNLEQRSLNYAKGDDTTLLPSGDDLEQPSAWETVNTLPEDGSVEAGEHITDEFRAGFSFNLNENWHVSTPEAEDFFELYDAQYDNYMSFIDVREVYDSGNPNLQNVLPASEDAEGMTNWFRNHPYLRVGETAAVNIGGVSGVMFDATASSVPSDYPTSFCDRPCVPLLPLSTGESEGILLREDSTKRVIVLGVGDELVVIYLGTGPNFLGKVGEVLDTLEWHDTAPVSMEPDNYYETVFKAPLSYTLGEGWQDYYGLPDYFSIGHGDNTWLNILDVQKVYDPDNPSTGSDAENVSRAPEDVEGMVEWFQSHPYLDVSEPTTVEVGGKAGKAFDVTVPSVPISSDCLDPCVPLFQDSEGDPFSLLEASRHRIMVLEVDGEAVTVVIEGPKEKFGEFLPVAQQVLHSVRWSAPEFSGEGSTLTYLFEPPFFFTTGEGWQEPYSIADAIFVGRKDNLSWLTFLNVQEVYERENPSLSNIKSAPEDAEGMVGWFRNHPYLDAGEPETVEVGGASGVAFDVTVSSVPSNYPSEQCGDPCVPLFQDSEGDPFSLLEASRHRIMVLEVDGEAVTVVIEGPKEKFGEFLPVAQQVLHSVRWVKEYAPGKEYAAEEFEPPLTFKVVGEGWQEAERLPNFFGLQQDLQGKMSELAALSFLNVQELYDPEDQERFSQAPQDTEGMLRWFRNHPYLDAGEPETVEVGGASGVAFDVDVPPLPEDYSQECGVPACLNISRSSDGDPFVFYEGTKNRVVILEVGGETVTITVESSEERSQEFLPQAQEVLDTVEWKE